MPLSLQLFHELRSCPADDLACRQGWTDGEKIRIVEESLQGYRHALLDKVSSWVKVSSLCTNR